MNSEIIDRYNSFLVTLGRINYEAATWIDANRKERILRKIDEFQRAHMVLPTHSQILMGSFSWTSAPQRASFWSEIHRQLVHQQAKDIIPLEDPVEHGYVLF